MVTETELKEQEQRQQQLEEQEERKSLHDFNDLVSRLRACGALIGEPEYGIK